MNQSCLYCNCDLSYEDEYFTGRPANFYGTAGNGIYYPSTLKHLGYIYRCRNEECESHGQLFYTNKDGDLHEGYPC